MSIISLSDRRLGIKRRTPTEDASITGQDTAPRPPQGFPAVGIDLGTTHCVVSVYEPGSKTPTSLLYQASPLVPSVLLWDGSSVVAGRQALNACGASDRDLIRSTKRSMGRQGKKQAGDDVPGAGDASEPKALFPSAGRLFSPEEAACEILGYLLAHEVLGKLRETFGAIWAVITVPAHFDDAARRATLEAASAAGIHVLRMIHEPTAAALAYSFVRSETQRAVAKHTDDEENLVVFDLGGGTFDVSVVHRSGLIFKVLASEGDMSLGGDDLDVLVAEELRSAIEPNFIARRIDSSCELYPALLEQARHVKHRFFEECLASVDVPLGSSGAYLRTSMDIQRFEEIVRPTLERTLYMTEQAVHMARIPVESISRILLVGGSTRVTLVRKLLEAYFPGVTVDDRLQPDLAVSWGAALQAAIISGHSPGTVLVDVCTHTLGIGVVEDSHTVTEHYRAVRKQFGLLEDVDDDELRRRLGGRLEEFNAQVQRLLRVAPIIRRNVPLPARKSEFFSTLYEDQASVNVVVVQGEGETVGDNRLIGSFLFALQTPCPKGTKCEIQLTYDVNGMVQVFARQVGTMNQARAVFDSRSGEVTGWCDPGADFAAVPGAPSAVDHQAAGAQPAIFNALLQRARRLLRAGAEGHLQMSDQDRQALLSEATSYESLLANALSGQVDEQALEKMEMALESRCEMLEH